MPKNIFHNEIDLLLEKIRQRHNLLKKIDGRPPRMEVDMMLADLRTMYEFCNELSHLPDEILPTPPVEKAIEAAPPAEPATTPENQKTTASKSAVLASEPVPEPVIEAEQEEITASPEPIAAAASAPEASAITFDMDSVPTEATRSAASLREKFGDTPTLNDQLTLTKSKKIVANEMKVKPISNLRTAIGINEKFIFVRDLFNGSSEAFDSAIDSINQAADLTTAESYISSGPSSKYNWKSQNKFVRADFMELVQRRFL